eukprot:TRINITY_DN4639_c0_g1_i3.p1 TRINITY_DN4639_c0_g1~~TRINITY_DN4639_c0_g1_i3.p1  ORF type:complete len:290 (-),score=122.45 TRINITY_DN4639_c0_g1_i3:967-1836(-)
MINIADELRKGAFTHAMRKGAKKVEEKQALLEQMDQTAESEALRTMSSSSSSNTAMVSSLDGGNDEDELGAYGYSLSSPPPPPPQTLSEQQYTEIALGIAFGEEDEEEEEDEQEESAGASSSGGQLNSNSSSRFARYSSDSDDDDDGFTPRAPPKPIPRRGTMDQLVRLQRIIPDKKEEETRVRMQKEAFAREMEQSLQNKMQQQQGKGKEKEEQVKEVQQEVAQQEQQTQGEQLASTEQVIEQLVMGILSGKTAEVKAYIQSLPENFREPINQALIKRLEEMKNQTKK